MKTLKEAKIERFGHQNRYKEIDIYYQITYIWEYKFLGIIFQKEDKVPILFEKESDATDFIECGCNVEMNIGESCGGTPLYTFYAYKMDEPDKKYKILKSFDSLDGYKSLFVVKGYYETEKTWISSDGGKISYFFEKIKQRENLAAQQKEKERKDKEYIDSLYEVKTYKIEKI